MVIYEICAWKGEGAREWLERDILPVLTAPSHAPMAVDIYSPSSSVFGEAGPQMMCHLIFADQASTEACLARLRPALADAQDEFGLAGELMRVRSFGIGGRAPAPLTASFSYVVRYQLPADDIVCFQNYYMKMHPPILAMFPEIRNVFCFVPLEMAGEAPLRSADYLIGNEVVFDSAAAFEAAMNSPVLSLSKADAKTFPAYSGRNAHYPMDRVRIHS